jgi:methyl-accepting chemotaxis protein
MKWIKIIGFAGLFLFMVNNLITYESLRSLDRKLQKNGELLAKAVRSQGSMGEKGGQIEVMSNNFQVLMDQLNQANSSVQEIAKATGQVSTMNQQMLEVNKGLNEIMLANLLLTGNMGASMQEIISIMQQVGELLVSLNSSELAQKAKVAEMLRLAVENNQSMPALP